MAHPNAPALCQNICQDNYIPTLIANMDLARITVLDDVAQERRRSTTIMKIITPELIPEYKQLVDQKAAIDNSLQAIQEAMELAITQTYWQDTAAVDMTPFYEAIEERKSVLELEAEVNRRVIAAAPQGGDVAM